MPKYTCFAYRTEKVVRPIVAGSPQEAADRFQELTGLTPSHVDDHPVSGVCCVPGCGEVLFVGLGYCICESGKYWCVKHNPYSRKP